MYKPLPQISEALEDLQSQLKRERDPGRRPRLHLLVLIRSGEVHTRRDAADHLALHRNTVGRWLAAYEEGGQQALLTIDTPGAKPGQKTLSPPVLAALQQRLREEGFPSYGEGVSWLAEEHGLEVPYKTVHGIVRYRLGAKLKRARPVHAKKTVPSLPASPSV